jgi:predicted DNA-binding WGR domain protein
MKKEEHVRQEVLKLIASDPNGEWTVANICERVYGNSRKFYIVKIVIHDMHLPGTWRLGWRKHTAVLYDPCSDARLADLEKRIKECEKKGWHENAAARRRELEKLRALKLLPPQHP